LHAKVLTKNKQQFSFSLVMKNWTQVNHQSSG
jgi:hypothetical protein